MFGYWSQFLFQVWDTAGQERFKSLRTPFYRGSDICILAYAIDDRSSFNNIKMWLNEFLHYAGVKNGIERYPFMVVGNKVSILFGLFQCKPSPPISFSRVDAWPIMPRKWILRYLNHFSMSLLKSFLMLYITKAFSLLLSTLKVFWKNIHCNKKY